MSQDLQITTNAVVIYTDEKHKCVQILNQIIPWCLFLGQEVYISSLLCLSISISIHLMIFISLMYCCASGHTTLHRMIYFLISAEIILCAQLIKIALVQQVHNTSHIVVVSGEMLYKKHT